MNAIKNFLIAAFYWNYDRGSWQWDICCLVFIMIIFTTPQDFLQNYSHHLLTPEQIRSAVSHFLNNFLSFW